MRAADRKGVFSIARNRIRGTIASPSRNSQSGTWITKDGGAVFCYMPTGNNLEAPCVMVETQEVGNGSSRQAAHVRVFDLDRWVEGGSTGLQGPCKRWAGSIRNWHRHVVVMDLVQGNRNRMIWSHERSLRVAHGV